MKRDDPAILKLYNITEEEAANPGQALLSAGVRKMYDILRFMELPYDLGEDGSGMNRAVAAANAGPKIPLWQTITGLTPGSEERMAPEQREEALENLVEVVSRLLRFEMNLENEKPNLYHTPHWDPLPKICVRLGISRAELSRLSKEATGLAAHELVDVVRVKSVKEKMKEHVRVFLTALRNEECGLRNANLKGASLDGERAGVGGEDAATTAGGTPALPISARQLSALQVWEMLRRARRGPQFHRGQWAQHLGFPNYARFYRACLVFFKLAPQQLELMAVEEVLEESPKSEVQSPTSVDENPKSVEHERLANVVWEELKRRHVQFFAGVGGKVWAQAG
jgi:AraC-like DNA-binding protein